MAVECIVPLLEMGVAGQEVLSIIDTALKEVGRHWRIYLPNCIGLNRGRGCCKHTRRFVMEGMVDKLVYRGDVASVGKRGRRAETQTQAEKSFIPPVKYFL